MQAFFTRALPSGSTGLNTPYSWVDIEYVYAPGESFENDNNYSLAPGRPIVLSVICWPISEFLAKKREKLGQSFNWPLFEPRLGQMNSARSGGVITIADDREGYLMVDDTKNGYRG